MKKATGYRSIPILALGCAAMWLPSVSHGAFAIVSNWVGVNNTVAPGNYGMQSPNSVGGTFEERVTQDERPATQAGQFSDHLLVGGPYGFLDPLTITGTVNIGNHPVTVDPTAFFGFYNSAQINGVNDFPDVHRLGLTFADSGVNAFRAQLQASNGASSSFINMDTNGNASGGSNALASGTYPFSITYDPVSRVISGSVGPVSRSLTLAASFNADNVFDRFGLLQLVDTNPNPNEDETYQLIFSDFNYTGNTVPEPSSVGLMLLGAVAALHRRR